MNTIIKKIKNDVEYIKEIDINTLHEIIIKARNVYFNNSKTILSDELYDLIIEYLKKNNIKLDFVGASSKKNKIKLDYWLGSINKIKIESSDLDIWIKKNSGPYIITDKLDGVSALLIYNNDDIKLFTRGDGEYGFEITNLINYLNIPNYKSIISYCKANKINGDKNIIAFRGELIIKKNIFNDVINIDKKFSNERNTVSGIVNSKFINKEFAKYVDFIIYEIVDPIFTWQQQYNIINELKFTCIYYTSIPLINVEILSEYFKERKLKSDYQMDGIVIGTINKYNRYINSNPIYLIGFKYLKDIESAIANVINVKWNISKNKLLIPTIIIDPVIVNGICIKKTSGFNAKFIINNGIAKGAVVKIIRSGDVIPYITNVIKKSSEPNLLPTDVKWEWTKNNNDIRLVSSHNDEYNIKYIYNFFKVLKFNGIGNKIIEKIYNNGFDTINKILNIKKEDLITFDNFKEKMADNIYNTINTKKNNIQLLDLMVASNKLGEGIGKERLKQILKEFPDIITNYNNISTDDLQKNILSLKGWNEILTNNFINNLNNFIIFYDNIKEYITICDNKSCSSINVVFSGWRPNEDLLKTIVAKGYNVINTINKNTHLLVIKDKNEEHNSIKSSKALQFNIKIIDKDEFIKSLLKK